MKNNLNILKHGYDRRLFHNIGQFFRNLKYAWQRIVYGYCDVDVWDLDYYYSKLFYFTLNALAEDSYGYPAHLSSMKEWKDKLREAANNFKNSQDWDNEDAINIELLDLFEEAMTTDDPSKKSEWLAKETEVDEYRKSEKDKALDFLKEYFYNLWD